MSDFLEMLRSGLMERVYNQKHSREELEALYEEVLSEDELHNQYVVLAYSLPLCLVERNSDRKLGTFQMQDNPRFYFLFKETIF